MSLLRQVCVAVGIFFLAGAGPLATAATPVVQLEVHPLPMVWWRGGLLGREIGRQAILLAAREELGANTRDAALREVFLKGTDAPVLDGQCDFPAKCLQATITLASEDGKDVFWKGTIPLRSTQLMWFYYLDEIAGAEAFSRKEIPDALKKAGVQGTPLAWVAKGAVPADVDQRLGDWNLLSEFWALRELHAAIHDQGESPERLGALARAYGQMGVSARILTGTQYAVFTARALLYAERLVVKDHSSAWALWNRAYVRALAGLQWAALEDLAAANKAAGDKPAPAWVPLVDEYCHYQTDDLLAAAKKGGPVSGIAAELAFMTVQHMGVDAYRMKIATEVLQSGAPCDALVIAEFLCDHSGPGALNSLVKLGPTVMAQYLPQYLAKMPGVPADAALDAADTSSKDSTAKEAAVGVDLISPDVQDTAEPSWSSLGRIIQDITFAHVWRNAHLIRYQWGVSADDYVAQALPLIANHPFKLMVAGMGMAGASAFKSFISHDLMKVDLSPPALKMDSARLWVQRYYEDQDMTAWEGDEGLDGTVWHFTNTHVQQDLALSPWSPMGIAGQIKTDWPAADAERKQWESRLKDCPLIAQAMTTHFRGAKNLAEAAKWGRTWVNGSPDMLAYKTLAEIYDQQGNEAQWKATLDEFLKKGAAYGLERERVRGEIANRLMDEGNYKEAWPYADDAAGSGAAFGTLTAVRCANGLGNWKVAENLIIELSQHYASKAPAWYFWCKSTGHGDIAAAKAFLKGQDSYWNKPGRVLAEEDYDILDGQDAAAETLLEKNFAHWQDPWYGMDLAMIYDGAGKNADRDRVLAATAALGSKAKRIEAGPELVKLAAVFEACLKHDSTAQITPKLVAGLLKTTANDEVNFYYLVGRFLELHGKPEDARAYYLKSVQFVNEDYGRVALSAARLRAMGVNPTTIPSTPPAPAPKGPAI